MGVHVSFNDGSPNVVQAQGATFDFYISTTGSDANPGTLAQPWAITSLQLGNANQTTMAGHRVGIIQGTYNVISAIGGSTNNDFSHVVLNVPSGTVSASTYVGSSNTAGFYTVLAAILDGGLTDTNAPNRPPLFGNVDDGGGKYFTIDGLEIRNSNDRLISVGHNTAHTSPGGSPGVVVKNCYVHGINSTTSGANSTGITGYCLDTGSLIHNNYVTDVNNTNNRNSGLEFWGCINTVVEYNSVVMSHAGSSLCYVKNSNQFNITIRLNYFDGSGASSYGGSGICAWDLQGTSSNTSYCSNNLILGNGGGGAWQENIIIVPPYADNEQFYNNTFVNVATLGVYAHTDVTTITYYNNITTRTSGSTFGDVTFCANAPVLIDYNLYPSTPSLDLAVSGSTGTGTFYTTIPTWAAALPAGCIGKDSHSSLGAPTFTGVNTGHISSTYQLTSGSLGHGTGSTNGQTSGAACDMGAWGGIDPNTGVTPVQIGCNLSVAP